MVTPNPVGRTSPDEILAQWEGPAIHEPGVLSEDREAERLSAASDIGELVAWLAVTALSGAIGDAAYAGIRAKVIEILSAWRRRLGQVKMDEVKQQLLMRMQQYCNSRKVTEQELCERVERLFAEIRG